MLLRVRRLNAGEKEEGKGNKQAQEAAVHSPSRENTSGPE
jgi:hypothetical protein